MLAAAAAACTEVGQCQSRVCVSATRVDGLSCYGSAGICLDGRCVQSTVGNVGSRSSNSGSSSSSSISDEEEETDYSAHLIIFGAVLTLGFLCTAALLCRNRAGGKVAPQGQTI